MASASNPPFMGHSAAKFWRAGTRPSLWSTVLPPMKASGKRRGSLIIDRSHPIPRPGADFQIRPAAHRHTDIVPASLILIVRNVSKQVLAVNFMADLGDRILQPLLLEETELL